MSVNRLPLNDRKEIKYRHCISCLRPTLHGAEVSLPEKTLTVKLCEVCSAKLDDKEVESVTKKWSDDNFLPVHVRCQNGIIYKNPIFGDSYFSLSFPIELRGVGHMAILRSEWQNGHQFDFFFKNILQCSYKKAEVGVRLHHVFSISNHPHSPRGNMLAVNSKVEILSSPDHMAIKLCDAMYDALPEGTEGVRLFV